MPGDDVDPDNELSDREYDEGFYDFDVTPSGEDPIRDNSPQGDDDRYRSARGWDPYRKEDEKRKKLIEKIRSEQIEPWHNMLDVRTASEWLTDNDAGEPPEQLFGDMWRTGEVAILFADTGVGKSILAVQIADAISRGAAIEPFGPSDSLRTPHSALRTHTVLYVDYELSQQQWNERYSRRSRDGREFIDKYKFADNFHRAQAERGEMPDVFSSFGECAYHSIAMTVEEKKADVVIIDNITWLTEANLVSSGSAAHLMKALKNLRDELAISILVIAHTMKRGLRPLSVNDLAGSKVLVNFVDNLFALGRSVHDPTYRYVKHVKKRNTQDAGADNVIVCRLQNKGNFPRFEFLHHATELSQISRPYDNTNGDRTRLAATARQLSAAGLTQRQIAQRLRIGVATVNRYLNQDDPE
jgi:RecA-family ATPase